MHLLTGATGLVGSQLVKDLAARGPTTVLTRSALRVPGATTIRGDLGVGFPTEVDVSDRSIIHCAAEIRSSEWSRHWDVNVEGTKRLLDLAVAGKARRLVFFSTGGVYGNRFDNNSVDESAELAPSGAYAHTKVIAERLCLAYQQMFELEITIFRLYFPYSNVQKAGIFSNIVQSIRGGSPLKINEGGGPYITPVGVEDIGNAVTMVLNQSLAPGIYNLCGDRVYGFSEIVKFAESVIGIEAVTQKTGVVAPNYIGSNTRLRDSGWKPGNSLETAIVATAKAASQ